MARDERSAGYMADAYGRFTNKPGSLSARRAQVRCTHCRPSRSPTARRFRSSSSRSTYPCRERDVAS
ncbi:hypothetical protein ACFSYD_24460 [Paracoccus aerius]